MLRALIETNRMRPTIFVFLLAVFCQCSLALEWKQTYINRTFVLPFNFGPEPSGNTILASPGDPSDFSWEAFPLDNCTSMYVVPRKGNGTTPVAIRFYKDGFPLVGNYSCVITAIGGVSSSNLTVNINAVSDWCSYHKNPNGYCESRVSVNSHCRNSTGDCICNDDYYGSKCQTYCIDEMCSGHGTCSYMGCDCQPNYYGTACDVFCNSTLNCTSNSYCNQSGQCTCNTNYYGANCSVFCNAATNCSNAGTCSQSGTCLCNTGYYGDQCQFKQCPACSSHGQCNNSTGVCECDVNYYGVTCDTFCLSNVTCGDHGSCNTTTGVCNCQADWFGSNCTTYCDAKTDCSDNGVCNNDGQCQCNPDHYGLHCDQYCSASSCVHGLCNSTVGCVCLDGYFGANCTIFCNGTGVYEATNGTCLCKESYFGASCETHCVANTTCNNRGYCDQNGSCICTDDAYFGSRCDINKLGLGLGLGLSGLAIVGTAVAVVICKRKKSDYGYEPIQG